MKAFFGKHLTALSDNIEHRGFYLFPNMLLQFMRRYLRLEVEGMEHVPRHGHAIILPNHSGWSGFDAVMLGNEIMRATSRLPRILAHRAFFVGRDLKVLSRKFGLREASIDTGLRLLRNHNMVLLFPEGEYGNFKPTAERYHLQEFRRGFVRMSLLTGAPIVPTIVIGAEETHINLASVQLRRWLKILPIPFNVFPLPAKWKIRFLEPIHLTGYSVKDAGNRRLVRKLAREVQERMQCAINEELHKRKFIFFPPPPQIEKAA